MSLLEVMNNNKEKKDIDFEKIFEENQLILIIFFKILLKL
jgi:hypothetical protein